MTKLSQVEISKINDNLQSTIRESTISTVRASYSPIIYAVKDFTNVLFDDECRQVATAEGLPCFIGAMTELTEIVYDKYNGNLNEGDIIISNEPYDYGGTHKPDINILLPIFYEDELVMLAASKAHYRDIGSAIPGSWASDNTSALQEGLMIQPQKIYREGELNEELMEMIKYNVRMPDAFEGDMRAQIAGMKTAEKRVKEIYDRFGYEKVEDGLDDLIERGEATAREHLRELPDGTWEVDEVIDPVPNAPDFPKEYHVKFTIEIDGTDILFDFSDCDEQGPVSSYNSSWAFCHSTLKSMVVSITNPYAEFVNDGYFEPIEYIAPEGTLVNPTPEVPLTVGTCTVTTRIIEGIWKALQDVVPDKVCAAQFGSVNAIVIYGHLPENKEPWLYFMSYGGGYGATNDHDGNSGDFNVLGGYARNQPMEVIEAKFPLFIENYELVNGSGGAGKYRGGLGVDIGYRVLTDGQFSADTDRWKYGSWGLKGGKRASTAYTELETPSGEKKNCSASSGNIIEEGSVIHHVSAGGGGWGDPLERPIEKVLDDVINEYISIDEAKEDYGVVIDPETLDVDEEATKRLRKNMAKK